MRVLIVEDEVINRLDLQRMLRDVCHADVAVNGREAVEAFRLALEQGDPYDLILLDIEMPVMNGQEALRAIRSLEDRMAVNKGGEVLVYMITAHNDQRNVVDAFFKGSATGYLVKPVDKATLLDVVKGIPEKS